jgi:thiamine-phosphate pyrophosphorylase
MACCYSAAMTKRHINLPGVWLVSDARNDAVLEAVLNRLPRGCGLIFRHYHLAPAARRVRFDRLARIARGCGHVVALSGGVRQALAWGADAAYGSAGALARGPAITRLATVHSLRELGRCVRADAVLLSPVFPTRSHPDGAPLGPLRFRLLARRSRLPVIALGGMNPARAKAVGSSAWAAIDGLFP